MNRQFDFRALLIQIQDRLSNDDRHRLHFLLGDIIPRMQRENVTLAGTLTVLESLFDRAVISDEYMDFLIRIFQEINCLDAVKRLEEFRISREPPKVRRLTTNELLDDNSEDDKYRTSVNEPLLTTDINSILSYKPDERKRTMTDLSLISYEPTNLRKMTSTESSLILPEKPNIRKMTSTETSLIPPPEPTATNDKLSIDITTKQSQKEFFKSPITLCLYGIFIFQILILLIYLWIFFHKKIPINIIENKYRKNAYVLENGKFLANISGTWFSHSKNLSLTFVDRLIRIDVYSYHDDMYSINFTYSQNKLIEHIIKRPTRLYQPTLSSLNFDKGNIQEIIQCYKEDNSSAYLVGFIFTLNDNSTKLFGSCKGHTHVPDKFPYHVFGYASGKMTQFLNGFQFVWYKICSLNNQAISCGDRNRFSIPASAIYKD